MLSMMQSREFGLGLGKLLTPDILSIINGNRRGEAYISENDALVVHNDKMKKDITDDPLLRYFRAGVNRDGYWNNSHSKIQLEDAMDCLSVLFPNFDFVSYMTKVLVILNCEMIVSK